MSVAITHSFSDADQIGIVTVRSTAPDPYEGLKGHAYIKARKLNSPIQRVQTSAQTATPQAEVRK